MSGVVNYCNKFITIITSFGKDTPQNHPKVQNLSDRICAFQTTTADPLQLQNLRNQVQNLFEECPNFKEPLLAVAEKLDTLIKAKCPTPSNAPKNPLSSSSPSLKKWMVGGLSLAGFGYYSLKNISMCIGESLALDFCTAPASNSSSILLNTACRWLSYPINEDRLKYCTRASADVSTGLLLAGGIITLYTLTRACFHLRAKMAK